MHGTVGVFLPPDRRLRRRSDRQARLALGQALLRRSEPAQAGQGRAPLPARPAHSATQGALSGRDRRQRLKRSTAPGSPKRLPPTRPVPSSGGVPSAKGEAQGLHCLPAGMGVRPQWREAFASAASCCHAQRRRLGWCPGSRPRPGEMAVSRRRHDVRPWLLARDRNRHDATPLAMPIVLPRESAAFPWKRGLVSRAGTPASDDQRS